MRKEYPKHKFVLSKDIFNSLICGMEENTLQYDESVADDVNHLWNTISRYARFYEENGKEFVQVNFYDKETDLIIWQFMFYVFAAHNAHIETDYFAKLKADRMEEQTNE